MRILETRVVKQSRCEFDPIETGALRLIGHLPPMGSPTAELWLADDEIEPTREILAAGLAMLREVEERLRK